MGDAGAELDGIMRDLDATTTAWVAAGYGYGTPEDLAREAVFARLKAWNSAHAANPSNPVLVDPSHLRP